MTVIDSALGIDEVLFSNDFILYPNPANNILKIKLKEEYEIYRVIIYNLFGQKVYLTSKNEFDISSLSNGLYLIKVLTILY